MFRIEKAYSVGPLGDDKMVVDQERGVWLQRVSGRGRTPGECFKLVWGDRVIPLDTMTREKTDQATGETYFLWRFQSFGRSPTAALRARIPEYGFAGWDEREAARLLAAEALLVFSRNYNGETTPDGYDRVEMDGQIYTKSDFGMT